MIASLYQSSSPSSVVTGSSVASMDDRRFIAPSRQTAKEQGGVAERIDAQMNAAPLDRRALAGDQVLDRGDVAALAPDTDLNVAQRKPEFMHVARQRDGHD